MTSAVALLMLAALTLTGCTSEASNIGNAKNKEDNVVDTGFSVSTVGSYDSADTAVVLSTDASNKAVSLINMETGKQYTLYYDGTTYVKDKYEGPMTISQIKAGDIVDITFLKGKKKLASIQKSPKAWVYDGVYNYDLAGANRTASIGSQTYSLPAGVVVLSEGRRMGTEEVVSQDIVTISGIDHKIYSVNVDRGHGYLRLKNDQPLLGGMIEVGNRVIRQITEDMLLVVPEGSYQVVLDNNGIGCVKEITVERDKEVVLDVGDVEIAEDKTGLILFEVTPASAKVSVDGKVVDISRAVELQYGIHQVVVEASGYDTLTKYIQVGSERAAISFTLEETRKKDNSDSSVSGNNVERIPWQDTLDSISKNSISDNDLSTLSENALTTSSNKVYVEMSSQTGVSVWVDGNPRGEAPTSFAKRSDKTKHEIILKKDGYVTQTYTITLQNTKESETFTFPDLLKEIPTSVISAAKSFVVNQNLTNEDVVDGGLKDVKKQSLEAAAKLAIGTNYNYIVEYTPSENSNNGTLSITVYREGYEERTISVGKELKSSETGVDNKDPSGGNTDGNTDDKKPDSGGTIGEQQPPSDDNSDNPSESTSETPSEENPEDPENPENPGNPENPENPEKGDNNSGTENGEEGDIGAGEEGGDGGSAEAENSLTTEQVTITQESHPIRNFFSSLFKK